MDEAHESALKIVGILQRLITDVAYLVEHGRSETASKALRSAMRDGWSEVGWRQHHDKFCKRDDRAGELTEQGEILYVKSYERPLPPLVRTFYVC